jgi:predicted MFS family arabinose efflux permease
MIYPFIPAIARGIGVGRSAVELTITARSALGLISPLFASLADSRGRKTAMLAALLAFTAGMAVVTVWPTYPGLFIGVLLAMVGKLVFDPAMQAYIGDRVHYTRRGLVIALTEMSWSGAFLLVVPVAGWIIARTDRWYTPFPLLGILGIGSIIAVWLILPADPARTSTRPSLFAGIRTILTHPTALAALSVALLISVSNEVIGIIYGSWMEDSFGLKITALGASAAVIGIGELTGEGLVARLVDRLGKRRAVIMGISLNALACLLLPVLGFNVTGALAGLFLFYLTFEFAIVSAIPLMTELVPSARATLMAGNAAALAGGRMLGSLIGPQLFDFWGLSANGAAGALFDILALSIVILFVHQE